MIDYSWFFYESYLLGLTFQHCYSDNFLLCLVFINDFANWLNVIFQRNCGLLPPFSPLFLSYVAPSHKFSMLLLFVFGLQIKCIYDSVMNFVKIWILVFYEFFSFYRNGCLKSLRNAILVSQGQICFLQKTLGSFSGSRRNYLEDPKIGWFGWLS